MQTFKYRLQVLLDLKIERRGQLQLVVVERQNELASEQEELSELRRKERMLEQKLAESRQSMFANPGRGLTGLAIRQHRDYLSGLTMDLDAARDAALSQAGRVREFERLLAQAWSALTECLREIEVLEKHRNKLRQRFAQIADAKEMAEQDEIGINTFQRRGARL